ncbi:MAG: S-formylglutathione hydrolase [Sphingomonadales bacterium]
MVDIIEEHKCFGGRLMVVRHDAPSTNCPMTFSVFVPAGDGPFPVVTWLSGLTCNHDNFTTKAGAYAAAAQLGLMIVAPDTSPRGPDVANDEAYDLGQGAGFYVNATEKPWAAHFRMYDYVTEDLPEVVFGNFPGDATRHGISGHSMGGHGALTIALRNPDMFRSVSAFAPIVSPTRCPWGRKALNAYLGPDEAPWVRHDASLLIEAGAAKGHFDDILVDQGLADNFLEPELKPELLEDACRTVGQKLTLRRQPGYDHSYYFISTFIADHLAFHGARLR